MPQPLGPTRQTNCPSGISRVVSWTASTTRPRTSNRLAIPTSRIFGSGDIGVGDGVGPGSAGVSGSVVVKVELPSGRHLVWWTDVPQCGRVSHHYNEAGQLSRTRIDPGSTTRPPTDLAEVPAAGSTATVPSSGSPRPASRRDLPAGQRSERTSPGRSSQTPGSRPSSAPARMRVRAISPVAPHSPAACPSS